MSDDNVAAFYPYAAVLDVSVEIPPMVAVSAWVTFGPFETKESASAWLLALEIAHAALERGDSFHEHMMQSVLEDGSLIPLRCFIGFSDVKQVDPSFRAKGALIPSGSPTEAAGHIHEYALRAVHQAVTYTLHSIESE